jgi:hypothetical protein
MMAPPRQTSAERFSVEVSIRERISTLSINSLLKKSLGLAAAALVLVGASSAPARADRCDRLRFKCEHKYELGLEGRGICRRYQEMCGGGPRVDCRALRYRCEHKYELGLEGRGVCRRYQEMCGGRGRL